MLGRIRGWWEGVRVVIDRGAGPAHGASRPGRVIHADARRRGVHEFVSGAARDHPDDDLAGAWSPRHEAIAAATQIEPHLLGLARLERAVIVGDARGA